MFFRTFGNRLRHAGMDFSNTIRSKLLPALAAFALFFVVSAAYFAPQFRGEALPQHDVIQYEGMAKDISDMRAATGEDPQWTGGMFGGMPAWMSAFVVWRRMAFRILSLQCWMGMSR